MRLPALAVPYRGDHSRAQREKDGGEPGRDFAGDRFDVV